MTETELFQRWTPAQLRAAATGALVRCCEECRVLLREQLQREEFEAR